MAARVPPSLVNLLGFPTGRSKEETMAIPDAVTRTIEQARDAMTVTRVFGEPFVKDGVTIIPAAAVRGGGGGGGGGDAEGAGGGGTGFGLTARPMGAFVIRDGHAAWQPAIDVNRIVLGAQVAFIVAVLARRSVARAKARATRRAA
jgi:uncharacterized spore protein YtfJ